MIKVFLDVEPKNQNLNKIITAIYKNFKIKGDVLFYIGRISNNNLMEFINLDIDDIYVLLNLIINKDLNDPSQFEFKHSFMYSIYYNYNNLPDKIFGNYSKVMMIKNNISNNALFNIFIESVNIDKEIMDGPILNDHIDYEKVMNRIKEIEEKIKNNKLVKNILNKDVSENVSSKNISSKNVSSKNVSENVLSKNVSENVSSKNVSENVSSKNVSENVLSKNVSENVLSKNVSENVLSKNVSEKNNKINS